MIEICLTKGQVAYVDDCDADLGRYEWFAVWHKHSKCFYANRRTSLVSTTGLHRVVMERILGRSLSKDEIVDHKNRVTLNCKRENLRLATPSQNGINSAKQSNNTTGYKGVSIHRGKYRAAGTWNKRHIHIGYFSTPEEAAIAYDKAALDNFGEFAYTNFPKENYK